MRENPARPGARPPVDAATVVLVREEPGGLLVYMGKRNSRGSFAGAHVFPGGLVEETDQRPLPGAGPEAVGGGIHAAAVRETFEECGVLLAEGPGGRPVPVGEERFRAWRQRIAARGACLADLALAEDLAFRPDWLLPMARWITPEDSPKRFDTRFFLARLPSGQDPSPDCEELVDGGWVSPAGALECQGQGGMVLFPPTFVTLSFLAGYDRAEDLFSAVADLAIEPVTPAFVREGGRYTVLLPHDPEYPGGGAPGNGGPSRLVMTEEGWRSA